MKRLLSWKWLFGLLVLFTVILASFTLYGIRSEREVIHRLMRNLIRSAGEVDSTSRRIQLRIDSLTQHLNHLTSKVTVLEERKDSLLGKAHPGRTRSNEFKKIESSGQQPLRRPVFAVIDSNGKVIGKDGIAADSVLGIKLTAGSGFAVRSMDVMLGRGSVTALRIRTSGNWSGDGVNTVCRPGDRIVIDITKVTRLVSPGVEEKVDVGTVIITIPIRAAYRP